MYIESVPNRNSPPCILLRECSWEDGKVRKRTLTNITRWPQRIVEGLRILLKGGAVGEERDDDFEVVRTLPHGHVAAILGGLRKIGLERLITSRRCRESNLVLAMMVSRMVKPGSKLATTRRITAETAASSIGSELGLEAVSEVELYKAMDWLVKRQNRIEQKLAKKHLYDGTLILYDVSSSYYTGTHCDLAQYGHDRDGKKGLPIIVYGLLCNAAGCPVAIEVFPGNTADPKTVGAQIQKIRTRFGLQRVVLVGDRGMITNARIDEEFRDVDGLDWITALRAPAIRKLAEEKVIQPSLFDVRDWMEVSSPDYPGERLVVCRNPFLATERSRKREELLGATEKELKKIVTATRRKKRRLRGKDKIGLRVGKVINRYQVAKHFTPIITESSFSYGRNEERIAQEAVLDGLYVIRTSVADDTMNATATVRAYKDLAKVERAFRSLKTVDLKVRPIYHWLASRVRAHVFLCMLAYYVEWHMKELLAPILFDDHDQEMAELLRDSIVAPARRSPKAEEKAHTRKTEEGGPVHSFQTLLDDLATLAKNWLQPRIPGAPTFIKITRATVIQQRAFNLLGVNL